MEIPNEIQNQNQEITGTSATKKHSELASTSKYDYNSGSEYLQKSQAQINVELEAMRQRQLRSKSEPRKVPYDKKSEAYWDLVFNKKEEKLEYEHAKWIFNKLWKREAKSEISLDEQDKIIPMEFVKWLIQDPTGMVDQNKGIMITGIQGCGKSTMMKAGQLFLSGSQKRSYDFIRVEDIRKAILSEGNIKPIFKYEVGNWCFDDVGQMDENLNLMGTKYNIVESLINSRSSRSYITLATTNLTKDQMVKKYGPVVASRMNQMFTFLQFRTKVDRRIKK